MAENRAVRAAKTRQQIEGELLTEVEVRLVQFRVASGEERTAAKDRLIVALFAFNGLILYGRMPSD
jgi:hypothetical protein